MPNYVITPKRGSKIELTNANLKTLADELKKLRLSHNPVEILTVQTGPRG